MHLRHRAPASFFIVAQLAVAAGARLREILDHDLFDLQSHSFTHDNMLAIRDDAAAVRRELVDSKRVIEDLFGREVIGFTAPGGFAHGFLGEARLLEALWEAGYRYVRTLSWQPNNVAPAPLTQPFWFSDDGYPDLLEISAHAWHDNILTGQPSPLAWPPALPWGYPSRLPTTGRDVYEAYAPGIELRARPRVSDLRSLLPPLVDLPRGQGRRADRPAAAARAPRRPDPGLVHRRVPPLGSATTARPPGTEVAKRRLRLAIATAVTP